jgi:hypothetical protein
MPLTSRCCTDPLLVAGDRAGTHLGPSHGWGSSGGNCRSRELIVNRTEFLSEAGAKRSVVDGAANLQQEIGTSSGPSHRLIFPSGGSPGN